MFSEFLTSPTAAATEFVEVPSAFLLLARTQSEKLHQLVDAHYIIKGAQSKPRGVGPPNFSQLALLAKSMSAGFGALQAELAIAATEQQREQRKAELAATPPPSTVSITEVPADVSVTPPTYAAATKKVVTFSLPPEPAELVVGAVGITPPAVDAQPVKARPIKKPVFAG